MVLSLLALLGVILVFGSYFFKDIERPWIDHVDFNGAVWSQAAHNILRAGLVETQGASSAFYFGPLPIPSTEYYLHHPPLLHLGLAGIFALFGEEEWVARLLPIGCTILSVLLLWLLASSCLGPRAAVFCAAVFTALPMALQYGSMVNFEPVIMPLLLISLLCLRYWEISGGILWLRLFYLSLLVGFWVDWAMHLFGLVLFVWFISRKSPQQHRIAWIVLAMGAVSGLLYLANMQSLQAGALNDLQKTFLTRIASNKTYRFTEWQWVCKIAKTTWDHYMGIGLLATAIGAFITFRRRNDAGFAWIGWVSCMVFAMDAIFVGVFQNDSFIHDYIGYYFIIPVSLMAGIAMNESTLAIERLGAAVSLRGIGLALGVVLIAAAVVLGHAQAKELHGRFCILDQKESESEDLIPALGEAICNYFPSKATILCNFMPYYGPQLEYYAQREMVQNLENSQYWNPYVKRYQGQVGGIIWMGAKAAREIISHLPSGQRKFIRIENETFCFWTPGNPSMKATRLAEGIRTTTKKALIPTQRPL